MKKSLKAVISCGVAISTILSSCATTDKGSEESKPQTPGKRIIRTVTTEQKVTKVQKDGQKNTNNAADVKDVKIKEAVPEVHKL